jgi:hypothetical protein
VRLGFGDERYANPAVVPLINALCKGPLNQWLNYFLPPMKLESKERGGSKGVRKDGATMTPLRRVRACAEVSAATKERLQAEPRASHPFALTREVERQMKVIAPNRRRRDKKKPPRNGNEGGRTASGAGLPSLPNSRGFG